MSDLKAISIAIHICGAETQNAYPQQPPPCFSKLPCSHWQSCENPHCFTHGCQKALAWKGKEVRS